MIFVNYYKIYYFCSLFHFYQNIVKQLLQERGSDVSTNMSIATIPSHTPTQIFLYHHDVSPHFKMISQMIVVALWLPLINLHLYQTKPPKIRLILTSTIMTTHSIFYPPEKTITIHLKVPLVYLMKVGVWCQQCWISVGVHPPQHPLSNLLI